MKYIKIPLEEANQVIELTEEMLIDGLNLVVGEDVRKYLNYTVIGNYSYVIPAFYDLVNKNRMNASSEEEIAKWDAFVDAHPNWEYVDTLPLQEEFI